SFDMMIKNHLLFVNITRSGHDFNPCRWCITKTATAAGVRSSPRSQGMPGLARREPAGREPPPLEREEPDGAPATALNERVATALMLNACRARVGVGSSAIEEASWSPQGQLAS